MLFLYIKEIITTYVNGILTFKFEIYRKKIYFRMIHKVQEVKQLPNNFT